MANKVIVVAIDDEEACLVSLSILLHSANVELLTFSNPLEALNYFRNKDKEVDLVLLDLMMPQIDGFEFLDILSSEQLTSAPVVIQTGLSDKSQINTALNKGAVDFINKPFDKDSLIKTINKYIVVTA
jgi:two-component system response regulator FixJ